MSKEKQIEEMREHICIGCSGKPCGEYCDKCKFVAEELLKHYQLKLPEDSVVLTKEELENMVNMANVQIKCIADIAINARKETAEKILEQSRYYGDNFYVNLKGILFGLGLIKD